MNLSEIAGKWVRDFLEAAYTHAGGEPFWGNAGAGVLPICPRTGRILVGLRSPHVNEPNTWGVFGGAIDAGEDPKKAALREIEEELGYRGDIDLFPAYVFTSPGGGFRYSNFIGLVDEEFEPKLNWETALAEWVTWDELQRLRPKHFGLEALLKHSGARIHRAAESAPELAEMAFRDKVNVPEDTWLYHVTYFGHLESIRRHGLKPGAGGGGIGATAPAYAGHSRGKVFVATADRVDNWYIVLGQHAEYGAPEFPPLDEKPETEEEWEEFYVSWGDPEELEEKWREAHRDRTVVVLSYQVKKRHGVEYREDMENKYDYYFSRGSVPARDLFVWDPTDGDWYELSRSGIEGLGDSIDNLLDKSLRRSPDGYSYDFNPNVGRLGASLEESSGLMVTESEARQPGKVVGSKVYVHHTALDDSPIPNERVAEAEKALPQDARYSIIRWDRQTDEVTFTSSPDWNAADEPTVGDSWSVAKGVAQAAHRPYNAENPQIYHHKWAFVRDDYQGFDVEASKARSSAWEKLNPDRNRIGYKKYWEAEVVPKLTEAMKKRGESVACPFEVAAHASDALTKAYLGREIVEDATIDKVMGGATALARKEISRPAKMYQDQGLLTGDVLDYGAGHDVHDFARYDPVHHPDIKPLLKRYDTIMVNYVLNVVPTMALRHQVLMAARGLLKPGGKILAAIHRTEDKGDWGETTKGYQCGWSDQDWQNFFGAMFNAERLQGPVLAWKLTPKELAEAKGDDLGLGFDLLDKVKNGAMTYQEFEDRFKRLRIEGPMKDVIRGMARTAERSNVMVRKVRGAKHGVHLRSKKNRQEFMIHRSVRGDCDPGRPWQVSKFDRKRGGKLEPWGHHCEPDAEKAVADLADEYPDLEVLQVAESKLKEGARNLARRLLWASVLQPEFASGKRRLWVTEAFRYLGMVLKSDVFVSDLARVNKIQDEMMVRKSDSPYGDSITRVVRTFQVEPTEKGRELGIEPAGARTIGLAKKYIAGKVTKDDIRADWKRANDKWLAKRKRKSDRRVR